MARRIFISGSVFFLVLFTGMPVSELQAQPVGVPMGDCKEWRNGRWVPCGSSNNPPKGDNTGNDRIRSSSKKLEEKNEKIRKANVLFRQAQAAAEKNDAKEALRLARAAQDMANDHKWLKDWVRSLEDYIANDAIRKKADVERIKGDAAYIRGDLTQALGFYKQALAIDANSLSDVGKNRIQYIELQLQREKVEKEQDKNTANKLKQDMQSAAENLKSTVAPPGLNFIVNDPMLVDGTNISPELPKAVVDAIPRTPAGDRLRKGFQAVMAQDWKVALAWFQDALNKEPGNPSLQRLVDLAQFTLNYQLNIVAALSENDSISKQTGSIRNKNSPIKSVDNKEVIKKNENGKVGFLAHSAAISIASGARGDFAFQKYNKEHAGHINFLKRAAAVQRAIRGEGYSKKEKEEQYQKALMEYYKQMKGKKQASEVEGDASVDEIILGGKG